LGGLRDPLRTEARQAGAVAADLLNTNQGPVYLREETSAPEAIAPERIVWIKRVFIDPPERGEEELPQAEPTALADN